MKKDNHESVRLVQKNNEVIRIFLDEAFNSGAIKRVMIKPIPFQSNKEEADKIANQ